jgi:hypothetical protein
MSFLEFFFVEYPILGVAGVLAAVMCVGSLFAGFTRRPDEQTDTCSECGCYKGHFGWCSSAGFHATDVEVS